MRVKAILSTLLLAFIVVVVNAQVTENKPVAFPGADGFGKYASGGRGGRVIEVTNLNDSGTGSFRQAVMTRGNRIVIFKVAGTIHLKKALTITYPNLTIAGQSAPGDGICIAGAPVNLKANNLIVRFLRFRLGDGSDANASALTAIGYSNIIVDHCSISWASGENVKVYNNANFTMQWCILSESLYKPKSNKKEQGYGALFGGMKASFHHNLFAHNAGKNPDFSGAAYHKSTKSKESVDFRNNVIYNWATSSSSGGAGGSINMVGNYYKPGPATQKDEKVKILTIQSLDRFYLKDNFVYSGESVSKDNWKGVELGKNTLSLVKSETEFPFSIDKTKSAEDAYIDILAKVGTSHKRDDVDSRIIQSTGTGSVIHGGSYGKNTGIIDSQREVGNWPELKAGTIHPDNDGDGIPDSWEKSKGLNPNDPSDAMKKTLDKQYDNIEVYLNSLIEDVIK